MKHNHTIEERYSDLLGEQGDAELIHLVRDLDAAYTAPEPPACLTLASIQARREHSAQGQFQSITARWLQPRRRAPRRIAIVTALALLLLVLGAAGYATFGTLLTRVLNMDPGTQQALQENLFQKVHITQHIGGFTVTVEKVYADANRVVVGYAVTKPAGHTYNHATLIITALTTRQGLVLPGIGGYGYGNVNGADAYAPVFDAAGITGNPKTLQLHLQAKGIDVAEQVGAGVRSFTVPGRAPFDFTVPFHPGRVANVHQSVTVGGTTVTLERVVVTLTETRVYLRGVGASALATLSVDGWNSDASHGVIEIWPSTDTMTVVSYSDSLFDKHGEWTLVVRLSTNTASVDPSALVVSGGPWRFQFMVP